MDPQSNTAPELLQERIRRNRQGDAQGVYSVCSAHPKVIDASIRQALKDRSLLLVESTSSQVNQYGGYTGQTPAQFAAAVLSASRLAGLPSQQILIGGDHLGPYPWRDQPSAIALQKAADLVRSCVRAGYKKIHLDASMACGDDPPTGPSEQTVAQRAALLCRAAEGAMADLPLGSPYPLYVIGTEVPTPGGETLAGQPPAVTPAEQVARTMEVFHRAFVEQGLTSAWDRVIGLVVQPGVEFGDNVVFDYDQKKAAPLAAALPSSPSLAYEAHSTDYQCGESLRRLVQDHFAILKVGPWLTFAFREAIFALSAMEQELFEHRRGARLSQVRNALDAAMLRNPVYWHSYYHGLENEIRLARLYSLSDRCRYYWVDAAVQNELAQLNANLSAVSLPPGLVSQYLPEEYAAVRAGKLSARPDDLVDAHIRMVLRLYASACGA